MRPMRPPLRSGFWHQMIRRITCAILKFALRVYFRRIEVVGLDNVPRDAPVIFVLNHPNALVDPVFLLCLAPRRVSFVAKATLFRMPIISYLVRALDSLPAYRRQDEGEDASRNLETFAAARRLLARGGTIGICPEGVSHNEPRLKPLKTGAARIALGAVSSGEAIDLQIVPVGLYYTEKTTFRSSALLYFGEPLPVAPVVLEPDGTPPREAVRELSDRVENALRDVILHAEQEEALSLIESRTKCSEPVSRQPGRSRRAAGLQADRLHQRVRMIMRVHRVGPANQRRHLNDFRPLNIHGLVNSHDGSRRRPDGWPHKRKTNVASASGHSGRVRLNKILDTGVSSVGMNTAMLDALSRPPDAMNCGETAPAAAAKSIRPASGMPPPPCS